jgi:hypothetical protein
MVAGGSLGYIGTYSNHNLQLLTNSTPAITINTAQNVGIGTDSPTSILQIKKSTLPRITLTKTGVLDWFIGNPSQGTSNNFTIGTNSGSNTEILTLDTSGNVGIGTTSPSYKLHAVGSGSVASFGDGTRAFRIFTDSDEVSLLADGSVDMKFYTSGSEKMRIDSDGHILLGTDNKVGWRYSSGDISYNFITGEDQILTLTGASWTTDATQSAVRIKTQQGEKLTVLNNGNVGIGTTSPQQLFHINNSSGDFSAEAIIRGSTSTGTPKAEVAFKRASSGDGATLVLRSSNSSGTIADAVTIDTSQNVGIGTTAPDYKLTINNTGGADTLLKLENTTSNKYPNIRFVALDASYDIGVGGTGTASGYVNNFYIYDVTNSAPRITLTQAGNVGINETNPDNKLEISDTSVGTDSTADDSNFIKLTNKEIGTINEVWGLGFSSEASGTDYLGAFVQALGNYTSNYNTSLIFGTRGTSGNATERMRITSGGDVLIGTTTTTSVSKLQLTSSNSYYGFVDRAQVSGTGFPAGFFNSAGSLVGSIGTNNTSTTYGTSSDYRLKEDLKDFNALDIASKIKMYDFKWKADDSRGYGVMAHELQEVLPQAVSGKKDAEKMQSVDYSKLVPILLKSIQELKAEIDELKKNK